jgi:hypothetical protein
MMTLFVCLSHHGGRIRLLLTMVRRYLLGPGAVTGQQDR